MNNITREQVEYFLDRSSFAGLRILYICFCSFKSKKAFKLEDLEKALSAFRKDYHHGFLIACSAMGLISFEENAGIYNITEIDEFILTELENSITIRASDIDAQMQNDSVLSKEEKLRSSRTRFLEEIKKYFNI
jgi:hypothetical protein